MLSFLSRHRILAVVIGFSVILTIFAIISFSIPLYGEICAKDYYTYQEDCAAYNLVFAILWQIRETINSYTTTIEALATIAIAGFTFTLWKSTHKLWGATHRAATIAEQSLIDLEGAFLYPIIISDNIYDLFKRLRHFNHPTSEAASNGVRPTVSFKFKNYGRSPALPQALSAVLYFGMFNEYHADLSGGFIPELMIAPNGETEIIERTVKDPIMPEDYRGIQSGPRDLLLKGSITFFDIFGNRYEQRFCLAWQSKEEKFMVWGTAELNRRKRLSS